MDRRDFMKFLGFSSFAFFASSCGLKKSSEKFIPFLIPPEEGYIPGEPLFKLTTCNECPLNCPVEAKLYDKVYKDKRNFYPVKFEGNRDFPFINGSLCLRGQAGIQRTFSPDRLKNPLIKKGEKFEETNWDEVYSLISKELKPKGNYIISGKVSGTEKNILKDFSEKFNFENIFFEFLSYSNIRKANEISFGIRDIPFYNLDKIEFLLTFGTSLFETFLNPLVFSKFYSDRKFEWFHLEPHFSLTGMNSDKRFSIKPDSEIYLAIYLLRNLVIHKNLSEYEEFLQVLPEMSLKEVSDKTGIKREDIKEIEERLKNKKTLIIAGDVSSMSFNGFALNLIVNVINYIEGNYNDAIDFTHSYRYEEIAYPDDVMKFIEKAPEKGNSVLFVNNINLFKFFDKNKVEKFLNSFKIKVLFTYFKDENSKYYDIIIPLSTFPEFKGDAEPFKNVWTIQNRLMEKLHNTKSFSEFIFDLMKRENVLSYKNYEDYVEDRWERVLGEKREEFIKRGYFVFDKKLSVKFDKDSVISELSKIKIKEFNNELALMVVPSLRFYDGRSKNLMLLNEIPDPLSSISWGEFVYVSRDFAEEMNLKNGDELIFNLERGDLKLPVFITEFLQKNIFMIDVAFYNRGFDIPLNSKDFIVYKRVLKVEKTGKKIDLPLLSGSFKDYRRILKEDLDEEFENIKHKSNMKRSMYPPHEHKKYRWAMVIDLDKCIGCSACVSTCYVENNVPCTGYKEHLKGREMSWIRIEPYIEREKIEFVPMLCQQCHNAPCEPVCPVSATFHNSEGLNVQVYNRCVGTRYCSNNCPFKVRRFNWFDWSKDNAPFKYWTEEMKLMLNPEVSKRPKGVMEKCTFCIQRIRRAEDRAKDEGRDVRDVEVMPACMQTCPTKAIIFGNLKDKESEVYKKSKENTFRIFEELGVEPSIYYFKEKNNEGKV